MCGLGTILLEAAKEWPVSIPVTAGWTFAGKLVVVIQGFLSVSQAKVHCWKGETKPVFLGSC